MSEYVTVTGIVGTDGIVPLHNPNGRWDTWDMSEIYLGQEGQGRYVPKVGDLVVERLEASIVWYEVESIDESTRIPKFKEKQASNSDATFTDGDKLLGVGPGTQADTFRVFIDKTTTPYKLTVDRRCWVNGTMSSYAKIFRGTSSENEANVISKLYDAGNNFIGTQIPLELSEGVENNVSRRVIKECHTSADLPNEEIVVAVFYSDTGHVVSKRQLLVENTAFIHTTDLAVKYITGIRLKSSFMSPSDPSLMLYPINVPVQSMNLIGVVEYSDGSTAELPVDGTKFSISGFNNFVGTVVNQELNLVLKYTLAADEVCYIANHMFDSFITKAYKAKVQKADGAYGVKLFGFPMWVDAISGYRMEWFLYNLDRSSHERVTPYVRINDNSAAFDPRGYGFAQALNVAINLNDVSAEYKNYRHTQTMTVSLIRPGTEEGTTFTVAFDPTQDPLFGVENEFEFEYVNTNLKRLDLTMGLSDYEEWIQRLYYDTKPLINPHTELDAPAPTHFTVVVANERYEHKVEEWTNVVTCGSELYPGATVFIEFFKRTAVNDIQLAVCGVSAKHILPPP